MINYYRASVRQSQKEAAAKLRPISAPTLVIWGERDSYLGSDLAEPDRDDVPNLDRVERLPDASHWVHHDEAERVNQLLIDFFAPRHRHQTGGSRPTKNGGRHEHHRRDLNRHPALPGRHSRRAARRAAPPDRLDALPSKELVADRSQGVQLATIQELARYWDDRLRLGAVEARLNALPQFTTEIDGVEIHFIHVKSSHENALPLIMTHGWPGSVMEMIDSVGPLTDPTAHGGAPRTPSTSCCPPCPGTASRASRSRWAGTWAGPHGPGPSSCAASATPVTWPRAATWAPASPTRWAARRPRASRHPHEPARARAERHHADGHRRGTRRGRADRRLPAVRQRLLRRDGHPPADDRLRPAGLPGRPGGLDDRPRHGQLLQDRPRLRDGQPTGNLTRDHILDNITAVLADRHRRFRGPVVLGGLRADAPAAGRQPLPPSAIPVGFTTFPGEIWRTPRSWVEAYPNVIYFNEVDQGGHFAAWEEPELFTAELRAAFDSLR